MKKVFCMGLLNSLQCDFFIFLLKSFAFTCLTFSLRFVASKFHCTKELRECIFEDIRIFKVFICKTIFIIEKCSNYLQLFETMKMIPNFPCQFQTRKYSVFIIPTIPSQPPFHFTLEKKSLHKHFNLLPIRGEIKNFQPKKKFTFQNFFH